MDQGTRDKFLVEQLKPELLREACEQSGQPLALRFEDGYEVTGDLEQHIWFDPTGAWVQWRLWRQGAAITLVRE